MHMNAIAPDMLTDVSTENSLTDCGINPNLSLAEEQACSVLFSSEQLPNTASSPLTGSRGWTSES